MIDTTSASARVLAHIGGRILSDPEVLGEDGSTAEPMIVTVMDMSERSSRRRSSLSRQSAQRKLPVDRRNIVMPRDSDWAPISHRQQKRQLKAKQQQSASGSNRRWWPFGGTKNHGNDDDSASDVSDTEIAKRRQEELRRQEWRRQNMLFGERQFDSSTPKKRFPATSMSSSVPDHFGSSKQRISKQRRDEIRRAKWRRQNMLFGVGEFDSSTAKPAAAMSSASAPDHTAAGASITKEQRISKQQRDEVRRQQWRRQNMLSGEREFDSTFRRNTNSTTSTTATTSSSQPGDTIDTSKQQQEQEQRRQDWRRRNMLSGDRDFENSTSSRMTETTAMSSSSLSWFSSTRRV